MVPWADRRQIVSAALGVLAMSRDNDPSVEELRAEATYASERLALYRRRMLLGRGDARRLAELERVAQGARDRLRRAEARPRD